MRLSYRFLPHAIFSLAFVISSSVGSLDKSLALRNHYSRAYPDFKVTARGDDPPTEQVTEPATSTGPDDFGKNLVSEPQWTGARLTQLFNLDGQVKWQDMTSKDGTKSGGDSDKIWYLKDAIDLYLSRVKPEKRNGVFWSGGSTTEDDFDYIDEFIESPTRLNGLGVKADLIYPIDDFKKMGLDGSNKNGLWWRAVNRMSKALAASAAGDGIAYVYLKPVNCRTIFSPPSQTPKDKDPSHNNQATNGEIWYYAELPMLMRNLNIKQIVSFYKNGRKFETKIEWDAEKDKDNYPRHKFDDIALDASPIVLPAEAGRPPLKRDVGPHGVW